MNYRKQTKRLVQKTEKQKAKRAFKESKAKTLESDPGYIAMRKKKRLAKRDAKIRREVARGEMYAQQPGMHMEKLAHDRALQMKALDNTGKAATATAFSTGAASVASTIAEENDRDAMVSDARLQAQIQSILSEGEI